MDKETVLKKELGEDYEKYLAFKKMKWVKPFTIDELLDSCFDETHAQPPESNAIYLVSGKSWKTRPTPKCVPLYAGSNTGKSPRFCTRIGDLVADMFGFFQIDSGHSSGGESLYCYCKGNKINPKELYISWVVNCDCVRCAEDFVIEFLKPRLNKIKAPKCKEHRGKEKFLFAFKDIGE